MAIATLLAAVVMVAAISDSVVQVGTPGVPASATYEAAQADPPTHVPAGAVGGVALAVALAITAAVAQARTVRMGGRH